MELSDKAKKASQKLSEAVNSAAEESHSVKDAIRQLREIGYEPRLTLQLELSPVPSAHEDDETIETDFSEADRKALRRMLIRVR